MRWIGRVGLMVGLVGTAGCTEPEALGFKGDVYGELIVLNENGAWSWFEDQRVVVHGGRWFVSSVADDSGPDGDQRRGDVDLVAYAPASGELQRMVLSPGLEDDDHNSAALYRRSNGDLLAVYSGHDLDSFTRYRITSFPFTDVTTAERRFDNRAPTTYSNIYPSSNGLLYNFTRTHNRDPHVLFSTDEGWTWQWGGKLLVQGDERQRPYVRYAERGGRIHFTTTEAHPRARQNSVFHGYIEGRALHDSHGTVLDRDILDGRPPTVTELTPVFRNGAYSATRAWTMDTTVDPATNHPVTVFSARHNDDPNDHRFFYARFDGSQWHVHPLAPAGGYLFDLEPDYTGLVAIDPDDPNSVFVSSPLDPRYGTRTSHYEIYQGFTDDGGATWRWASVTGNSLVDNIRPVVPQWDRAHTAVMWLRGVYTTFTDYNMAVVGKITEWPPDEPITW